MIVQPDFLDHWKTLKLTSVLSDPLAPIYILRLWSYVQTSRRDIIPDDAEMIKAVCRWGGPAPVIRSALVSCGWIDAVEGGLLIHGWSELNARLIHNWTVGKHGGRPRVTTENPRDNPRVSQTKPIRVDKIRGEENIEGIPSAGVPEKKPEKNDPPEKKPRERNLHMDALSTCEGGPVGITPPTWKKIAKALADIRAASPDVTPDEILRRIANYRTHFPECACTATAMSSHWATCATAKPAAKAKNAEHSSTIWLDESENRRKPTF